MTQIPDLCRTFCVHPCEQAVVFITVRYFCKFSLRRRQFCSHCNCSPESRWSSKDSVKETGKPFRIISGFPRFQRIQHPGIGFSSVVLILSNQPALVFRSQRVSCKKRQLCSFILQSHRLLHSLSLQFLRNREDDLHCQLFFIAEQDRDSRSRQYAVLPSFCHTAVIVTQHRVRFHPFFPGRLTPSVIKCLKLLVPQHMYRRFRIKNVGHATADRLINQIEISFIQCRINASLREQRAKHLLILQPGYIISSCFFFVIFFLQIVGRQTGYRHFSSLFFHQSSKPHSVSQQHCTVLGRHIDLPGCMIQFRNLHIFSVMRHCHSGNSQKNHKNSHSCQCFHQSKTVSPILFFFHHLLSCRQTYHVSCISVS